MVYLYLCYMLFSTELTLFQYNSPKEVDSWRIVNDGVMGGLSKSHVEYLKDVSCMRFMGYVSLENYGGFASTRSQPKDFQLSSYKGIKIRLKGDGKRYKFRIRTNDNFDGMAYSIDFQTKANEWSTHSFLFAEMNATFRGRVFKDHPPIQPEAIRQLGFLIADKQKGNFKLDIDWIKAIK